MPHDYSQTELEFKKFWVNKATKALGKSDSQTEEMINGLFDKFYTRSHLEIENTQSAQTHNIPADKFFLGAKKKFILNESGTLTWKHKIKLGVIIPIIQNAIQIRQIKKKAKVKAAEIGDSIKYAILNNEEYTLKIIINGLYGLFLYIKSIFYNSSVGATVTAAGRNVISTSALTVELIGNGFRSYLIDAHLQIINNAKEETPELIKKYTLPKVDVETVLKHMLLYHYDDYYNKGFLRDVLSNLTEDELSVVYLKNNFNEFIKVPEVKEVINKIYMENNRERTDLTDKQKELYAKIVEIFNCKELSAEEKSKAGKHYMVAYAKDEVYGPLSKKLKQMSGELLMGFYFYSGDYIDGKYAETSVDIFETMSRVKIPTADTDSNVSTVFDENVLLNEEYSNLTKNDEYIQEVATTVLATIIFTGSIDASLSRYTQAVGVDEDYSHLIEMEEETTMYDLHLTTGKKKYVFSYFIQDGNFNPKVYENIKIKGLQSIKSDYNAEICERVNNIFKNRIMVKLDKLSYKDVIMDAKYLTFDILKMVKTDDYIINKSTIKKSNKSSEELAFGDAKNKMSRLWARFGIPGEINFPGSFKELDVKFSYETLKMIEDELPETYNALVEHVKEIKLFEFYRNVINGFKKLQEERSKISLAELAIKDEVLANKLNKMLGPVSRLDSEQLNETFAKKLAADLFPLNAEKATVDLIRKALVLGPRDIIQFDTEIDDVVNDITNSDIIENIVKIGLPIDINTVPDFIKINNYDIIDTEFAATGEFLLGALTDTLGISCPRNTSDKMLISSALQSY